MHFFSVLYCVVLTCNTVDFVDCGTVKSPLDCATHTIGLDSTVCYLVHWDQVVILCASAQDGCSSAITAVSACEQGTVLPP